MYRVINKNYHRRHAHVRVSFYEYILIEKKKKTFRDVKL